MIDSVSITCAACQRTAAVITFCRASSESRSTLNSQGFLGETTIYGDEVELAEFYARISRGDLLGRTASEAEFLGFFCRACMLSYCQDCWTGIVTEFDEGFYDYTQGTCPMGHEQVLDD